MRISMSRQFVSFCVMIMAGRAIDCVYNQDVTSTLSSGFTECTFQNLPKTVVSDIFQRFFAVL